jgi:DNA-binding MarR family transcriptional regulator
VKAQRVDLAEVVAADLVEALRDTSRVLVSYLVKQAHVRKLGLIEYLVLIRACDEDGVTARDAGRAFDLNTSTMTGISDRLENEKLVRRRSHPTDRRLLVLKATRRGQEVVNRTIGPLLGDLHQMASALDAEQRELLTGTVQQISERIRQEL